MASQKSQPQPHNEPQAKPNTAQPNFALKNTIEERDVDPSSLAVPMRAGNGGE